MDPFAPFRATLEVAIRRCRQDDLPALEWWGLFAPDRDLIRQVFARQQRGAGTLMLVAEAGGMACGQAWIDLGEAEADEAGVIWAVRVFPCLQGLGIGRRLMRAAEASLLTEGRRVAEVSVEKTAARARRFYERLGYAEARARAPRCPPGSPPPPEGSQWVLRRALGERP
jgi:ribosomal protein S18 acetylase RimI-like enzyme